MDLSLADHDVTEDETFFGDRFADLGHDHSDGWLFGHH